jgi:hypothetical protein
MIMSLLSQLDSAYATNPDPDYVAKAMRGLRFPIRADLVTVEMVKFFGDTLVCIQSLKPDSSVHMKYFSARYGVTSSLNKALVLTLREAYRRHLGNLRQLVRAP